MSIECIAIVTCPDPFQVTKSNLKMGNLIYQDNRQPECQVPNQSGVEHNTECCLIVPLTCRKWWYSSVVWARENPVASNNIHPAIDVVSQPF